MPRYIVLKDREVRIPDGDHGRPIVDAFPNWKLPEHMANHLVYEIEGETFIVKPAAIRLVSSQ